MDGRYKGGRTEGRMDGRYKEAVRKEGRYKEGRMDGTYKERRKV